MADKHAVADLHRLADLVGDEHRSLAILPHQADEFGVLGEEVEAARVLAAPLVQLLGEAQRAGPYLGAEACGRD